MSGYDFFFQADNSDQISLLKSIKTTILNQDATSSNIQTLLQTQTDKQPSRVVRSKCIVLDSQYKDVGSSNQNPSFTLPAPLTCGQDEYMTMAVMRWNAYNDFEDLPANSQITFQKGTNAPFTLTLSISGKPLTNNVSTAIKNAWILGGHGGGFDMTYGQNTGIYTISYTSQLTMRVLNADLARYMNVPFNQPIVSDASFKIYTGVLRQQKTINLALCVSGVNAYTPSVLYGTTGKNVLCHLPVLSNPFILANYRSYVENEQALRITDQSVSTLSFEYLDIATGQTVPIKESCLTLEVNIYKL
jgi:hypothetical protein